MRILYGVVGEGMGHATRSRVTLEHLLSRGHEVHVVVSGRAHHFLVDRFRERKGIAFEQIHGLHLNYEGNSVDLSETVKTNLGQSAEGLLHNISAYLRFSREGFKPELVISDFESWAYLYGLNHRLPVVSIDNMQVINRCQHEIDVTALKSFSFRLAKLAVKIKLPHAYHYLVSSFFFPPVRKARTTLVAPILRPEILAARREPGDHVLVYQTAAANQELVPTLQRLPYTFRVYGMGRQGAQGNVTLCPFSEQGFVDDLRTARAVIAGGGYSLMGEAVHLHVPMLSLPLAQQYEQELNARYLEKLGYGAFAEQLDPETLLSFLGQTERYAAALEAYSSPGNEALFGCVDELLRNVELGGEPLDRLESPAMGKYDGPPRRLPGEE